MDKRRTHYFSSRYVINTTSVYVIFTLLFIAVQCITAQSDGVAPFIIPTQPDHTVLPSETVNFQCKSTEPILWRFFNTFSGNFKIHYSYNQNEQYPFESTLELPSVDFTFVGFYYCVKNSSSASGESLDSLVQINEASNIYLFVEDPQHPLVEISSDDYVVYGSQYQEVIIPCKPTSKMWDIQLIKEGDESHQFESRFDPTRGYFITLNDATDAVAYVCHARMDVENTHDQHAVVQIDSANKLVDKPRLKSNTPDYGIEGGQLELTCSVNAEMGSHLDFKWKLPKKSTAKEEGRVQEIDPVSKRHEKDELLYVATGRLIVSDLQKDKDTGVYNCSIMNDSGNRNSDVLRVVKILGPDEWFLEVNDKNGRVNDTLIVNSGIREAKWLIKYRGYPLPTMMWRDPRGNEIPWSTTEDPSRKIIAIDQKETSETLISIRQPKIGDSGIYTLYGDNGHIQTKNEFKLLVREMPTVSMDGVSVKPNEVTKISCAIYGFPTSNIKWEFIPCEKLEFDEKSCDESKKITLTNNSVVTVNETQFNQTSTLTFTPPNTGIAICTAFNGIGKGTARANVIVNDLDEDFIIWSNNEPPISAGDDVTVTCGASAHKYATELNWYKDDVLVESDDNVDVRSYNTKYSHRKELHWKSIPSAATGKYVCRANVVKDDSIDDKTWDLEILEPTGPHLEDSNIKNGLVIETSIGEPQQFRCKYSGIPHPTVKWYKDGSEIVPDKNASRITLHDDNTVLDIHFLKDEDDGKYKCVASNRIKTEWRETVLKITNKPSISKALIFAVVAVILILVVCTLYLFLRIRRERRLFRELKAAGLANFEKGNPDSINPDLALDEQADLLPYDNKYEFPREKLKLGKQVGAGAFGVVIKGIAQGILPYEDETTVAVKMVKQMADNEVMRALISELKIMVHLGQHLNVVNLLGAVTKNIAQREVMVIVEYCRFGNLQNFLVKHRQYFIDQIVKEKDIIDPSIQTKDARWSTDSGFSYLNRPDADRQSVVNSAYIRHASVGDYFPGGMDSANTEATLLSRNTLPGGEDNPALSNNSTQPAWRSNYQSDYKGPKRSVTTTDLLYWAFQVARGMDYLASRKVLHGDLAARNILLCDDNVVKICDFGLARSMYKTDNYRKKGEGPLPFKWLAIESISDQVFSTHSDVWAFGIVLWELFSLGKVPYPGMDADRVLYFKLKDGYRMDKPEYATQDIYDIMLSCWGAHPESRPTFGELEKSLSKFLDIEVAERFIDLNEPYLKSNVSIINSGQTDYLALMGPPDCPPPPTPHSPTYVNSHVIAMHQIPTTSTAQPDYLAMSNTPISINSPMPGGVDTHDSHFPFSAINSPTVVNNLNATENLSKHRNKMSNIPEEIPMLKRSNQSIPSDSDSKHNATDVVQHNSNSNLAQKNSNVLNTVDNYVNVPSTKINPKKDTVSNPGYIVVSNVNETRT